MLDTALELVKTCDIADISLKKIAEKAGMSERTLYRHFNSRAVLMEELAERLHQQLKLPEMAEQASKLVDMPALLYKKLEVNPEIVQAILHAELQQYNFAATVKQYWGGIKTILDANYPGVSPLIREAAAANISYFISASTWHYYRNNYKLDLATTIKCAEMGIEQALTVLSEDINDTQQAHDESTDILHVENSQEVIEKEVSSVNIKNNIDKQTKNDTVEEEQLCIPGIPLF